MKQYYPIIVRQDGTRQPAKFFSSRCTTLTDRYCNTLDEAQSIIKEVTDKLNNTKPHIMVCGNIGIETEHDTNRNVIDSYIKVREVSDWERI